MPNPIDERLIMAVAQRPFEVDLNKFCTLVPVLYLNGTEPTPSDFPNDGEIWWMLTAQTEPLAVPGSLVVGSLELAVRYREYDSTSSRYQVVRESVRSLDLKEGLEVVDIPGEKIDSLQDIVSGSFLMELTHRPTPRVMIRWRSEVFGPFTVTHASYVPDFVDNNVSFTPTNADMTVFKVGADSFQYSHQGVLDLALDHSVPQFPAAR
jgi:hypothetical protein